MASVRLGKVFPDGVSEQKCECVAKHTAVEFVPNLTEREQRRVLCGGGIATGRGATIVDLACFGNPCVEPQVGLRRRWFFKTGWSGTFHVRSLAGCAAFQAGGGLWPLSEKKRGLGWFSVRGQKDSTT